VRVALLRAINVGGRGTIAMRELSTLMTDEGFARVKTLLQSGNVVFRDDERPASVVAGALEAAIAKRFAMQIDIFVRDASDMP
jgi:uncharacterized protein (DUF1697 family)